MNTKEALRQLLPLLALGLAACEPSPLESKGFTCIKQPIIMKSTYSTQVDTAWMYTSPVTGWPCKVVP